jgi:zinc transport system substrate-binding protein
MERLSKSLIALAFLFLLPNSGFASGKLSVFVSIVPQKFFVQQIGMDLVDVQAMVQPGHL